MNPRISPDLVPAWIPATGHALHHVGVHFDAIRIGDFFGEQVAYEIMQFTDFRAGPIIRSAGGRRNSYFLLPPDGAAAYTWPAGTRALGRYGPDETFVGVPALHGNTWPLDWRSLPCSESPFVDPALLYEMVGKVVEQDRRGG